MNSVSMSPMKGMAVLVVSAVCLCRGAGAGIPEDLQAAVSLQAALDRAGFGVGPVDGSEGARTLGALRDFCKARQMTEAAARNALTLSEDPDVATYTAGDEDAALLGGAPKDWLEASAAPQMAHDSMDQVIAERFHASPRLIRRLNPAISNWDESLSGVEVTVPNTREDSWRPQAARLEVDCRALRIRAFGADERLIASFPCSIAMDPSRVPTGELRVASFAPNPNYTFDPANFPESARAREIGRKLILPPGPRNPVGVYWLGLSAPGFGIHGTPKPETIGRRESHGCFRLTNWDITTLAGMVTVGTPVRITGTGPAAPRKTVPERPAAAAPPALTPTPTGETR